MVSIQYNHNIYCHKGNILPLANNAAYLGNSLYLPNRKQQHSHFFNSYYSMLFGPHEGRDLKAHTPTQTPALGEEINDAPVCSFENSS